MNQFKVFISYRRADTQHAAGRLADRLGQRFPLFMDIDNIQPGSDFTTALRTAMDDSDVLLVVIGPHYLDVGADGQRRIDRSDDWVAEEVATGLARDIEVVPVLVDGATLPDAGQLPPRLQPLARRQAVTLAHRTFNHDCDGLMTDLVDIERTRFEQARPGGTRRYTLLVALAAAVLLTISEILLDNFQRPGLPLLLLTAGLCASVALLVRDSRRHQPRSARILRRSGLAASGLGTALYFASHALYGWLQSHGVDLGHNYYPVLLVLPLAAAVAGYVLLHREIGRTAIWPSLILVLISAACFPIHVARVFGLSWL